MKTSIPFKLTLLASAIALTGCGGGGGGGGSNVRNSNPTPTYTRSSVSYHTPTAVDVYAPMTGTGVNTPVSDIFTRDLNNDSVDEVVVGGRMSQPATAATWRNTNLQLYGWNSGSFSNETSTWFSGTDNQIVGTEPSIKFGDFDGDGNVDMFTAPSTDMTSKFANPVVFRNTGSDSFTRSTINTGGDDWSHDSWVGDLDGDGRDDIVMSNIGGDNNIVVNYGQADGTFDTHVGGVGVSGGSGISIADYMGNGSKTVILTDASSSVQSDTKLYSIATAGGGVTLTEIATLPKSRFHLAKHATALATAGNAPHGIRNFSLDFNNDGLMDVVVIDNLSGNGINMSETQFLRNNGAGSFTDVTDDVLVDYDTGTQASYQPVLVDINNDGLDDIVLSSADDVSETGYHDSTRVLVQTSDGKFVQKYENVFKDFYNQIQSDTAGATDSGQPISVVVGPDGEKYLFSTVIYTDNGNTYSKAYLAKIGSTGTITPQTAADIISANWPYLSDPSVNEVLANTSPLSLNGVQVVDLNTALDPVNGLGISMTGRLGYRIQISGNLSVPGFDTALLNNVSAVDGLGRHYQVDMSRLTHNVEVDSLSYSNTIRNTVPWSTQFAGTVTSLGGFHVSGNNSDNFGTGLTTGQDWQYTFSMGQTPGSPWLAFDGVFGEVENSQTMEFAVSRSHTNGIWYQGGVMQTKTNFRPGLVTEVDDLWAGYAVTGYEGDGYGIRLGLQPQLFSGNLKLSVPESVDSNGVMHYNNYDIEVRNTQTGFVGLDFDWGTAQRRWNANVVADQLGNKQANISVVVEF